MKNVLLIVALLSLSACFGRESGPVRTVTQEVVREVPKPCPADVPARPTELERPLPTNPVALAAILGAKLAEYAGPGQYADRADAIMARCTVPAEEGAE